MIERALVAGQLRDLPLGTIHDVVNRAVEPATSIHVYSPPLTTMTYYDPVTFQAVDTERGNRPTVLGPGVRKRACATPCRGRRGPGHAGGGTGRPSRARAVMDDVAPARPAPPRRCPVRGNGAVG